MQKQLYHHGIKGQRWGVRRFQNEDGTLTSDGQKRYSDGTAKQTNEKRGLSKKQKRALVISAYLGATVLARYGYKKLEEIGVTDKIYEKAGFLSDKISSRAKKVDEARKRVARALKNPRPVDWNEINRMTQEVNRPNGGKMPVAYDLLRLSEMIYDVDRVNDHKKLEYARAMKPSDLARDSSEYAKLFDKSFSRKRGYR